MRLGDDQLRLAFRGLLRLDGSALGGDERRGEQLLAALQLGQLLLELLDLVRELAAVAPHLLEAVGDLVEEVLDGVALVAEQPAPDADVSQLDRGIRHLSSFPSALDRAAR